MNIKIAIHNSSSGFHPHWIRYCEKNQINYKVVNCYSNTIVRDICDCHALMWHHNQANFRDLIFAKQLLYSLQHTGKHVFPDYHTAWHFDDKVGQKYLLEACGADLVPSHVFYDKNDAMNWARITDFPKVFKLRGGAGSANVRLVKNRNQAMHLIRKAFGRGFSQYEALSNLKERIRKFALGISTLTDVGKGLVRILLPPDYSKMKGRERGYVYFQDYIPCNTFDIRVVVIGKRAFAIKRMNREDDFRASGSGIIMYEKHHFSENLIKKSFDLAGSLRSSSLAIDYVFLGDHPLVVEISYGFMKEGYDPCPGYWDSDLNWIAEPVDPCGWMVDLIVKSVTDKELGN